MAIVIRSGEGRAVTAERTDGMMVRDKLVVEQSLT
jgi:hypothetical protein